MLEEVGVFYRGLMLGVMVSAPVGPIGLLCIRRTIQKGLIAGFATGLGAAMADTMFGAVAAYGVAAILDFMRHYDLYIRILGGLILLFGAYHTWHDKPKPPPDMAELAKKMVGKVVNMAPKNDQWGSAIRALLSGLAITLTNPVTIFAVLAVVATFGSLQSTVETNTLITGIFMGAAAWWITLSGGIALVRGHFTEARIIWINRITAVILGALAIWAIVSGMKAFLSKTFQ